MAVDLPMAGVAEPLELPGYPRPITSVHQVELASDCNLRCKYCVSPVMHKPLDEGGYGRAKEFITRENFEHTLKWARHFEAKGTQGEFAMTGIGEALMHPDFVDLLRLAREALPGNLITFSTNGILVTEQLCEQIAPYNPRAYVSLHRPERAKPAIDLFRRYGLLDGTNSSFATDAFDWAGGLDWDVSIAEGTVPCEYLRAGWCVIHANGDVTTCCLDASGASKVGHVTDIPGSLSVKPWEGPKQGCRGCHMSVVEPRG